MNETPQHAPRPLRADAERNRQAIIGAAARVFAEQGTAVTLEHIAEVAGVGVGTIYRRFPSVESLVTVVMEEKIRAYADRSEQAVAQAQDDARAAFSEFVFFMLEQQATDLAFSELVLSPRGASDLFRSETARALDASIRLVERAKAAGVVRDDFDHSDLYLMLNANAGLVRGMGRTAPDSWRRFGQYMLQAFGERGETELVPAPAAWGRVARKRKSSKRHQG